MLIRRFLASASVVALLVSGTAAGQDTINLKDGSTKQGTVQEWHYDGLKMTLTGGGGTTTLKPEDVQGVTFGKPPQDYKQADDELGRGKFEDAAAGFQAFVDNAKNKPSLRQEAAFKVGLAYMGADKADEAIKAFKSLLEAFPQTHYLENAERNVALILIRTGKASEAVAFLEGEESRVTKLPQSSAIVDRLKLEKAKSYLAAGDTKKAKSEADTIAGGTTSGAAGAKVLQAQIAVAEKDLAGAKTKFNEAKKVVTAKSDRAACFNGLGSLLLEEGKNAKKEDLIRDARELFLRTVLVEVPEAGESTEAHEIGLYNAAVCFQYLGELGGSNAPKGPESKGGGGEAKVDQAQANNLSRAREIFRRFLREYPQSKYAADAQTRLQKLGG